MDKAIGQSEPDDIDLKIDHALDRCGQFVWFWLRVLAGVGVLGGLIWAILFSPYAEVLGPVLLTVVVVQSQIMFGILFAVILFVAILWFLGRARMYWILPGDTSAGFSDYQGNPHILEFARRVVTLLRGVKHSRDLGGEVHRGLLLIGPPGTGKAHLAQCIATEAGVPFCYASASSFQAMFFGISNLRIMMLYGKARKLARKFGACIVFIDEIDAIGQSRGAQQGPGIPMGMFGRGSALLNELLLQMDPPRVDDGVRNRLLRSMGLRARGADRPAVLTMGATNIPQVLDVALLRPGRFDWKITIDVPDFDGRKDIIQYYLAKVDHDADISIDRLAHETIGYTPAAIKYVINEAVVVAHFDKRDAMEYRDFMLVREMYEWGLRQPIRSMSSEERRRDRDYPTVRRAAQRPRESRDGQRAHRIRAGIRRRGRVADDLPQSG